MTSILSLLSKSRVSASSFENESDKRKSEKDAWVPGTAGNTTTTVEISISCRGLADKDLLTKSDPMCVLYHRPPGSKGWVPRMRTECIENELDPDFATKAVMEYRFEQVQQLRFEVYDIDDETVKLTNQDIIGYVEVTLAQIVTAGEEGLTMDLTPASTSLIQFDNDPFAGSITLTAEELASEKDEVNIKIMGNNCGAWRSCLPPKSFMSLSKVNNSGKYLVVHRSIAARGVNPTWKPVRLTSNNLCCGDQDRVLKIEVYQRRLSGGTESIGSVLTTLNKMLRTSQEKLPLVSPKGQPTNSSIKIMACNLQPIHTFMDFVQSGTQIHCCFAIDFTCSNGDPSDSQSLHFVSNTGNAPNPYEQAIQAVGNIVKDYDYTSSFPAFGFGARIPPRGDISHNFPITLKKGPNCNSVPGVLEAYRDCVGRIQLFAPTNFAPVINTVAQLASKGKPGEHYYILVIITDGVISDMVKTKKAIVDASGYPLSIIIIGVGEADFNAMEELDGDAVRLSYKKKVAQRDIVQFVAYRSSRSWMTNTGETTVDTAAMDDYRQRAAAEASAAAAATAAATAPKTEAPTQPGKESTSDKTNTTSTAGFEDKNEKANRIVQSQLAMEVLMEIPEQITGYMRSKNIIPNMIRSIRMEAAKPKEGAEGAPESEEGPTV